MRIEFQWRGITWELQCTPRGFAYRDKAHLGGPWTSIYPTIDNPAIHAGFRRALHRAVQALKEVIQ